MDSQESIYVNLQELHESRGKTQHQRPEKTKTNAVGTHSEAEEETETRSPLTGVTVCLGLLCFLLLTAVITVGVKYDSVFKELSRDLANHTAEKLQLLSRYQNLTDERDQLQTSLKEAAADRSRALGVCPDGWKRLGCSCYLLSTTTNTWDTSRQQCRNQGADLVIVTSREEMMFLNQLGAHLRFWIGLSTSSAGGSWTWTDGRPAGTTYWKNTHSYYFYHQTQECAAFNSFQAGWLQSWSRETCTQYLRWVCEKKTVPSDPNV